MPLNRRQLLASLSAGVAWGAAGCRPRPATDSNATDIAASPSLRQSSGETDWRAVRALFPLTPDWTHFASFLLASHPKPVAAAIDRYRRKLDEEPGWLEDAAFSEAAGKPSTKASFVSPGGFLAFEHVLALPAAVELHKTIGRDRIAARIRELNTAFREGAARIPGVTVHTPLDPDLSAGISCFEVAGVDAEEVTRRLLTKRIRTSSSPYKVSYARVAAGIMNFPEEIDRVLSEIRGMTSRPA